MNIAFPYGWIQGLFLLLTTALDSPYKDDAKNRWELTWLLLGSFSFLAAREDLACPWIGLPRIPHSCLSH